jgi:hypothetical protein
MLEPRYKDCEKKSFIDKKEANTYIRQLRSNKDHSPKKKMRAYQCDKCQFWHITSKTEISDKVYFRKKKRQGNNPDA